jgi:hypothetical protein
MTLRRITIAAFLLALCGCLNLDFSPDCDFDPAGPNGEAAVFEPKLIGDWDYPDPIEYGDPDATHFTRVERKSPDSNTYVLSGWHIPKGHAASGAVKDNDSVSEMHLLRLGRYHFLSVAMPQLGGAPEARFIMKLNRFDDEMHVSVIRRDYFADESHRREVSTRKAKKSFIIDASPEELRKFLETHAETEGLWEKPELLGRRR